MSEIALDRATPGTSRLRVPLDRRRAVLIGLGVAWLVVSIASLRFIGFSPRVIIDGFRTSGYLGRALPPSFELWPNSLHLVLRTFMMAVAGTGLAGILSIPLAFLSARNTAPHPVVSSVARTFIVGTRAIPDLIFAIFFVAALSIGELPGVLALGVHSIGMLAKLLADSIEETDFGSYDAALAAGATRSQAIANSVVPQVTPGYLSNLLYRLDVNTRVSVVLGFVGAGGIGQELRANLRNPLRYPVGIGQALMVFALILVVDRVALRTRKALDGASKVRSEERERTVENSESTATLTSLRPPWTRDRKVLGSIGSVLGLGFAWSCFEVGLNPVSFVRALIKSASTLGRFLPPDFSTYRAPIITGFKETLALGVASTFIGFLLAIPFSLLVARNTSPNRVVGSIARLVQVVLRSIPELVIVLFFVSAVGLGPLPGAVALSIGAFGISSKLLADAIESLPEGPLEGVRATGATRSQQIASGVTPTMVPTMVANGLYCFDINVRSSSVLGIVGAGGIGRVLDETLAVLQYGTVSAVIIGIFAIVMTVEFVGTRIRRVLL